MDKKIITGIVAGAIFAGAILTNMSFYFLSSQKKSESTTKSNNMAFGYAEKINSDYIHKLDELVDITADDTNQKISCKVKQVNISKKPDVFKDSKIHKSVGLGEKVDKNGAFVSNHSYVIVELCINNESDKQFKTHLNFPIKVLNKNNNILSGSELLSFATDSMNNLEQNSCIVLKPNEQATYKLLYIIENGWLKNCRLLLKMDMMGIDKECPVQYIQLTKTKKK